MSNVIAFLKSHWAVIAPVLAVLWSLIRPDVLMFIMAHPTLASVIAAIALFLAGLSPTPQAYWKGVKK